MRSVNRHVDAGGVVIPPELGAFKSSVTRPCVVVAQGHKENLVGLVVATADAGKLVRLDMCISPPLHSAQRTGTHPGLD